MSAGDGYTIAAIPTVYRGRRYRSRLEARWAAFFDLLGWKAEYEPFDLGGWSPDFLLTGPYGCSALVEVKPFPDLAEATVLKALGALRSRTWPESFSGVLVTRAAPQVCPVGVPLPIDGVSLGRTVRLDSLLEQKPEDDWCTDCWGEGIVHWHADDEAPAMHADFLDAWGDFGRGMLTGLFEQKPEMHFRFYQRHTMELWARATNLVQWKGPGK